jgi:flagellar biosynthesis GTPase FlhF
MEIATGLLLVFGLILLMGLVVTMVDEEQKFRDSFKHLECKTHKWVLVDAQGRVPENAPLERKLNALMICEECAKMPQIYTNSDETE